MRRWSLIATPVAAATAWAAATSTPASTTDLLFLASTPCDAYVKRLLTIPPDTPCDFIRWRLSLENAASRRYSLALLFGEAQPNTLGFVGGGRSSSFAGRVDVVRVAGDSGTRETYRLEPDGGAPPISLLKLNDNLLHVLTAEGGLLTGNGGWSYTLNRDKPDLLAPNPAFGRIGVHPEQNGEQTMFEGRTPCREIAPRIGLAGDLGCFKVKWSLTLHRDPVTRQPTTYALRRTGRRSEVITGRWEISAGAGNERAVVYRLDPEQPAKSLSFLALDAAVLFFLDERGRLLTGNADFSYTLNRRVR